MPAVNSMHCSNRLAPGPAAFTSIARAQQQQQQEAAIAAAAAAAGTSTCLKSCSLVLPCACTGSPQRTLYHCCASSLRHCQYCLQICSSVVLLCVVCCGKFLNSIKPTHSLVLQDSCRQHAQLPQSLLVCCAALCVVCGAGNPSRTSNLHSRWLMSSRRRD
jgi:hypothetical protein